MKDLNNELSRKLEVQTQRLELLTAQSMANENIPARLPNSHTVQDSNTYADEGDEVWYLTPNIRTIVVIMGRVGNVWLEGRNCIFFTTW